MSNVKRTIHTDLFTPKAQEILHRARLFMRNYWGTTQMARNAALAEVAMAPNGEVIWKVYEIANNAFGSWRSDYYNNSTYANRHEDKKVREWLCMVLKEICFRQFKKHAYNEPAPTAKQIHKMWSSKNNTVVKLMSEETHDQWQLPTVRDDYGIEKKDNYVNKFGPITVAEIYCVYEKLLNRKRFEKKYSKEMKELIVGTEKDTVATELEIARREEINRINQKFEDDKKALAAERYEKINKMREEILAAYKQMEDELVKEHAKALKKLENKLNFLENGDELGAALFG